MSLITVAATHEDETTVIEGTMGPISLRNGILREIMQLSDIVFQIKQHLAIVASSIQVFDLAEVLRDTNGDLLPLFPQWNSCREIYSSLLTSSHLTARQLKRMIDDSLKTLIPLINDSRASFDNKQEWVIGFVKGLDDIQTRGTDTAQEFCDLREKVRYFERNLRKEMETQDANAQQRIKEITDNIKQLEAEIEASLGFFSACRSVFSTRTVLRSASAMALAPISSTLLLVSGVGALGYVVSQGLNQRAQEIQGKRDSVLNLHLEQMSLDSRRDKLREIGPRITQLTSAFDDIVNGLGAMQQMWKMISLDAIGIHEAMGQLRNARTSAGFDRRIPDVEKLWRALACTLDEYACGVGPAWHSILKRHWPLILLVLWELWNFYFGG